MLSKETNEHAVSAWLGYLDNVVFPPLPPNAKVLLALAKHKNEQIRAAAIRILVSTQDTTLGTAFVDSGWSHYKGQNGEEAINGTYLIATYGGHLEFEIARSRIAPQGLAILVEKRGMRDDEVRALFEYAIQLLDEKVSERKVERYGYALGFNVREPWRKIALLDDGAIIAKIRQVATAGQLIGFFDLFPLVEISEAIMELRPAEGAEIWALVKKGHHGASLNIGDFNNLPFRAPDHEKIIALRENSLGQVKNDQDLVQIAFAALQGGHEQWLIGSIREDIAAMLAGLVARGLTLAGLLDETENATRLWKEEIEPLLLTGWLAKVRDEAWRTYQRNVQSRYWFAEFLASRNADDGKRCYAALRAWRAAAQFHGSSSSMRLIG